MKRPKNKEENKIEYGTISLPLPLIKKVKRKISGTGMNSVSSYVAFILREVLSSNSTELYDKKDMKLIKSKLKSLGY